MRVLPGILGVGSLLLAGCQSPVDPPAPPELAPAEVSSDTATDDEPAAAEGFVPVAPGQFCAQFDPSALEWFDWGASEAREELTDNGTSVQLTGAALPPASADRYNTIAEVCPGFFLATTFEGETALISIDEDRFATTATLQPAGSLDNPSDPGVNGGGPIWGFRDSLAVGDDVFFSDGVLDVDAKCVSVAVHRVSLDTVLTSSSAPSEIVYRSEPCVSYTDDYRANAPIRTHLGAALTYRASVDELYLTIGDFHLGSSTIGQAEAAGIDNVERDYELLRDPEAAISAVVAIANPAGQPESRIFAKGLRNSLGITVVRSDRLWLTDHGPQGGDELNLIEEGLDYGWPLTSEGQPYDRSNYPGALPAPWLDIYQAEVEGTEGPFRSWSPAIAPTAIVQYPENGSGIASWDGGLVISSLRGQALFHLSLEGDGAVVEDRLDLGERIRDMVVTSDGQLVLITDSSLLLVVSP